MLAADGQTDDAGESVKTVLRQPLSERWPRRRRTGQDAAPGLVTRSGNAKKWSADGLQGREWSAHFHH